jgi:hypothetical protein
VVRQTADNRESGRHRMGFESPALRAAPSFGRAERRVGRLTLRYHRGRLSAVCDLASRFTRLDPPSRRVESFSEVKWSHEGCGGMDSAGTPEPGPKAVAGRKPPLATAYPRGT